MSLQVASALRKQLQDQIESTQKIATELREQGSTLTDTVKTLHATASTSNTVLHQTERMLKPLNVALVHYDLLVPTDDPNMQSIVSGLRVPTSVRPGFVPPGEPYCDTTSVELPGAGVAHNTLDLFVLFMGFFERSIAPQQSLMTLLKNSPPDYSFEIVTRHGNSPNELHHQIFYDEGKRLHIQATRKESDQFGWSLKTFKIVSIPDLINSFVLIT